MGIEPLGTEACTTLGKLVDPLRPVADLVDRSASGTNGTGSQQYRIKYSDYEQDQSENWITRKVVTTYRRGDKEGSDTRKIEYFEPED